MNACPHTVSLRCVTDGAFEPVSLDEAKLYVRVDAPEDDAMLTAAIAAARGQAEGKTRRILRESEWGWVFRGPVSSVLEVPVAPCSACLEVTVDGVTLPPSAYVFVPSGAGGGESPLMASLEILGGVEPWSEISVKLTAGYADGACPEPIKQWILVRVSDFYENRESFVVGANFHELSRRFVDALLDPYLIP